MPVAPGCAPTKERRARQAPRRRRARTPPPHAAIRRGMDRRRTRRRASSKLAPCAAHTSWPSFVMQEPPGRPVQASSGVRTDVEPRAHGVAVAIQDQRFGVCRRPPPRLRRSRRRRSVPARSARRGVGRHRLTNRLHTSPIARPILRHLPVTHSVTHPATHTQTMFIRTFRSLHARFDATAFGPHSSPRKPRHPLLRFAFGLLGLALLAVLLVRGRVRGRGDDRCGPARPAVANAREAARAIRAWSTASIRVVRKPALPLSR